MNVWQMAESRIRHRSRDLQCTLCPPGWGVIRPCSFSADTLCSPCGLGSYSPHHSYHTPCWPCSHCGPGLYQAHSCTSSTDTVCDSCQRLKTLNTSIKQCPWNLQLFTSEMFCIEYCTDVHVYVLFYYINQQPVNNCVNNTRNKNIN